MIFNNTANILILLTRFLTEIDIILTVAFKLF